jgi:hypothetical protein
LYGWDINTARFSPLRDIYIPNFAIDELGVNTVCLISASHVRKIDPTTTNDAEHQKYLIKVKTELRARISKAPAGPPSDATLAAVIAMIAEYAEVWADVRHRYEYHGATINILFDIIAPNSFETISP